MDKITKDLAQSIIAIKSEILCPICLDVIQDTIEFCCGHKLCSDCYLKYKSSKIVCPICKAVMKRRSSVFKDDYLNHLGKFIFNLCEKFEDIHHCKIEEIVPTNYGKQNNQPLKKKSDSTPVSPVVQEQTVTSKSTKITKQITESRTNDLANTQKDETSHSKSKLTPGSEKQTLYQKSNKIIQETFSVNRKKLENQQKENKLLGSKSKIVPISQELSQKSPEITKETAFDKLLTSHLTPDSLRVNKGGRKRTYSDRKKEKDKEKQRQPFQLLNFENDKNKEYVLQWLNDIRNKFDRLTQTQSIDVDQDFDTIIKPENSVSQRKALDIFIKPLKIPRHARSKSVDLELKKTYMSKQGDCYSELADNYNIDDINTEEEKVVERVEQNILISLIEDEILDNLDAELEKSTANKRARKKSKIAKKAEVKHSLACKEVQKESETLKKAEVVNSETTKRVRKESETSNKAGLNHSVASTSGWDRVSEIKNTLKKSSKQPKQLKIVLGISQSSRTKKGKRSTQETPTWKNVENDVNHEVANKENIHSSNLKKLEDLPALENYSSEIIKTTQNAQVHDSASKDKETSDIIEENNIAYDEPMMPILTKEVENIFCETRKNINKTNADESENIIRMVIDDCGEDPYNVPTQRYSCYFNNDEQEREQTQTLNNVEDITTSQTKLFAALETNVQSCIKILDRISLHEAKAKLASMSSTLNILKTIIEQKCLTKEVEVTKCDVTTQTDVNVVDHSAQTLSVDTCHKSVQTYVECIERGVQTTLKENSYSQNNSEPFLMEKHQSIQNLASSITQGTIKAFESLLKETDFSQPALGKEGLESVNKSLVNHVSKLKTQDEVFTSTFDNLNFDTQDLAREFLARKNDASFKNIAYEFDAAAPETSNRPMNSQAPVVPNKALNSQASVSSNRALEKQIPETSNKALNIQLPLASNKGLQSQTPTSSNRALKSQDQNPQDTSESRLVCSLRSQNDTKVNRQLIFKSKMDEQQKHQRCSDSDSDSEIRPIRKRQRLTNNNLSIEFETYTDRIDMQSNVLTSESETTNYDECLNRILRNYDGDSTINKSKPILSSQYDCNIKTKSNSFKQCNDIIAEVNKNVENLNKKNFYEHLENDKDNDLMENRNSVGNILANDKVSDLIERKNSVGSSIEIEEKVLTNRSINRHYSEFSDIIGETESLGPIVKKMKLAKTKTASASEKENNSPKKSTQNEVLDEFNDSFDEAELENIDMSTKGRPDENPSTSKIVVLGNVVLNKGKKPEETNGDMTDEDDLFAEDDDDVVASTPQKKKNESKIWLPEPIAIDLCTPEKVNLSQNIEDFDFDLALGALPPPPAFQDDVSENNNQKQCHSSNEVTVLEKESSVKLHMMSLTPDDLSQYITKDAAKKLTFNQTAKEIADLTKERVDQTPQRSRPKLRHSTPSSQAIRNTETLGISPITIYDSEEIVSENRDSFTEFRKQKSQQPGIMSSTPGQKSIWNYVRPSQGECAPSQQLSKPKPYVACSRLPSDQMAIVSQLSAKKLINFFKVFSSDVTHMIVCADNKNRLKDYTVKFVNAVAAGIWVLRSEWLQACLDRNSIAPEEPYEVLDDVGGEGPRTSRLTRKQNPLFNKFKFYCPDQFISTTKKEVEGILQALGGKIVASPQYLRFSDGRIALIVTESRATQDFDVYEKWLDQYRVATVDIEWLSKCVGRYKILSIRPYIWCCDENLAEYGYPDYLIENVPFTDSEQTY